MEAATHSSTSTSSQLPTALTARILQQIPQRQRLTCCSRVCRAWRDAAAQATVDIECSLSSETAQLFEAWLAQHAGQVKTLKATGPHRVELSVAVVLPWERMAVLQSLSLSHLSVASSAVPISNNSRQGSSAGSQQGTTQPLLPHLRELQLTSCILGSADALVQLASNSPQLTSLVVERGAVWGRKTLHDVLPAVLEQLPGLIVLRLPNQSLSPAAARCVAATHSLRELQLGNWDEKAPLPSSVTSLTLEGSMGPILDRKPKLPTQLPALTQLLHLHLRCCAFPAAALGSLPQLQHVHLYGCLLLPPCLTSELESRFNRGPTEALLGSVAKLKKLQHLHSEFSGLYSYTEEGDDGVPEQWSALTASAHLTHLCVKEEDAPPLLKGAVQHMFPAGRLLPNLQHLTLHAREHEQFDWCLDGTDLASIVAACPGLRELGVASVVQEDADVSALLRLPASCTRLHIGGDAFDSVDSGLIQQLTQLRSLKIEASHDLTDIDVLALCELTGLTRLELVECLGIGEEIWDAAVGSIGDRGLRLESSDSQGPVYKQLRDICYQSPDCAGTIRTVMEDQLADAQRELAASQEQLAQTQAQLAASQEQVQQLQQQLAAVAGLGDSGGVDSES